MNSSFQTKRKETYFEGKFVLFLQFLYKIVISQKKVKLIKSFLFAQIKFSSYHKNIYFIFIWNVITKMSNKLR